VAVPLKGPLETPTDRKKNKPQFPVLLLKILGFTLRKILGLQTLEIPK